MNSFLVSGSTQASGDTHEGGHGGGRSLHQALATKMIIDHTHRRWIIACLLVAVVGAIIFVPYAAWTVPGPRGGSVVGLAYGITGTAFIVVCALLGARKKVPTWRVGRAETWMRAHLWLGLASLPLILFHSGFRFGGTISTILMVLFLLIVGSGIVGMLLQHFLPRRMLNELPMETVYEEIPHVLDQLRLEAGLLVWNACGSLVEEGLSLQQVLKTVKETLDHRHKAAEAGQPPEPWPPLLMAFYRELGLRRLFLEEVRDLMDEVIKGRLTEMVETPSSDVLRLKEFYRDILKPYLADSWDRNGPLSDPRRCDLTFSRLRAIVSPAVRDVIADLSELCLERRQLERQRRMHRWLQGWLFVHVPLSMALLVLTAMHAIMSVRY